MKKFLIIVLVLGLLGAGVLAVAYYNLNAIIAYAKPYAESSLTKILGSRVTIGKIEASVRSAQLSDIAIGDSLKLQDVSAKFEILPLLSRSLIISELTLKEPAITLVKDKDGISIPGMAKRAAAEGSASTTPQATSAEKKAPFDISLKRISVKNGKLLIEDRTESKSYTLDNINYSSGLAVNGGDISLTDLTVSSLINSSPISVRAPSLAFNNGTGIAEFEKIIAEALGTTFTAKGKAETKNGSYETSVSSSPIDLTRVVEFLKTMGKDFSSLQLKGEISPQFHVKSTKGDLHASGPVDLKNIGAQFGNFTVSDLEGLSTIAATPAKQDVSIENLALKVNGTPATGSVKAEITKDVISLSELSIKMFGGLIGAPLRFVTAAKDFSTTLAISNLQIDQIMSLLQGGQGSSKLFGKITSVTGPLSGRVGPDLKNSMNGQLKIQLNDGGIRGVNLGGLVLKQIKDLPLVTDALFAHVPAPYRTILESENTEFQSLAGSVGLRGGKILVDAMKLTAQLYQIDADGVLGMDSSADLNATITFSKEFSLALATATPGFKRLLSADDTLVLPLTIRGTFPKVIVIPNISKLIAVAGKEVVKEQASKLIDKALGAKGAGIKNLLGF